MRWAEYVASMMNGEACAAFWSGKLGKSGHCGDTGIEEKIILR
jgi:hypothetical protein